MVTLGESSRSFNRYNARTGTRSNTNNDGVSQTHSEGPHLWCSNGLTPLHNVVARSANAMPTLNLPPGFDFTDPDIYAERLPVEELAEMRKSAPIWWNEQPIGIGGFDDGGYWVVTKHKDVKEVSLRSDVFSSLKKTALPRYQDGTVGEQIERGKFVLLNMDAPHHTHLRKIISRAFTPRSVERLREDLHERAQTIVKTAAAAGSGDFVEEVSC